eukprot:3477223-Karenia_brevis.AAC.1
MTSEVSKVAFVPASDDNDLRQVVDSGHVYYILKDGIPDSDMEFLSEYLNSDQNENQVTSEISTLSQVDKCIAKMLEKTPHPTVSNVVKAVTSESLLKLRPDSIGDMAHYCISLSGTNLIQQLVGWHSRNVNPRELSVSPRWLADAAKAVGKRYPLTLLGLTLYQYRGE